jgi:hypothetical protein
VVVGPVPGQYVEAEVGLGVPPDRVGVVGGPRWPEASTRSGAILYAFGGLIVWWLLVDLLPHVHIAISWH